MYFLRMAPLLLLQGCGSASPPQATPAQAAPAQAAPAQAAPTHSDPTQSQQPSQSPATPAAASATAGGGATCEDGTRCPGEQPICLVAPARVGCVTRSASDAAPHDGRHLAFACSRGSDCEAPLQCCTSALGDRARCAPSCDVANELWLCASDQECTTEPLRCLDVTAEEDGLALPRWVRACQPATPDTPGSK